MVSLRVSIIIKRFVVYYNTLRIVLCMWREKIEQFCHCAFDGVFSSVQRDWSFLQTQQYVEEWNRWRQSDGMAGLFNCIWGLGLCLSWGACTPDRSERTVYWWSSQRRGTNNYSLSQFSATAPHLIQVALDLMWAWNVGEGKSGEGLPCVTGAKSVGNLFIVLVSPLVP